MKESSEEPTPAADMAAGSSCHRVLRTLSRYSGVITAGAGSGTGHWPPLAQPGSSPLPPSPAKTQPSPIHPFPGCKLSQVFKETSAPSCLPRAQPGGSQPLTFWAKGHKTPTVMREAEDVPDPHALRVGLMLPTYQPEPPGPQPSPEPPSPLPRQILTILCLLFLGPDLGDPSS